MKLCVLKCAGKAYHPQQAHFKLQRQEGDPSKKQACTPPAKRKQRGFWGSGGWLVVPHSWSWQWKVT